MNSLVKSVYREHINKWGEPDRGFLFGERTPEKDHELLPNFIEVLLWLANDKTNINTFSTIGMTGKAMNGVDFRTELHFSVRGKLTEEEITSINTFMMQMAIYPFNQKSHFNWFHVLSKPGPIPCYDKASCLMFAPSFIKNGWKEIENEHGLVKILNLVPITPEEWQILIASGFPSLSKKWQEMNIDLFARR